MSPASIAPCAQSRQQPAEHHHAPPRASAKPLRLATMVTLLYSSSRPTPIRATTCPLKKLIYRYPTIAVDSSTPSWLMGKPKVLRIDGHATPSTPSGSPRLTNATKAIAGSSQAARVRTGDAQATHSQESFRDEASETLPATPADMNLGQLSTRPCPSLESARCHTPIRPRQVSPSRWCCSRQPAAPRRSSRPPRPARPGHRLPARPRPHQQPGDPDDGPGDHGARRRPG